MPTGRRRTEGPHYRSGHRLGGVGLRSKPPWHHGAIGPSISWDPWPRPVARAAVGTVRSVHKSVEMALRSRFGSFVYTVAPWAWVVGGLGIATVYTDRRKRPISAILGHLCTLLGCCAVVDRRGDAGVYTDRQKRPLGAVSGHLCTLLRRESRYESRRELCQVARAPQPPRRAGGAPSLAPLAWSGRRALSEWRRC